MKKILNNWGRSLVLLPVGCWEAGSVKHKKIGTTVLSLNRVFSNFATSPSGRQQAVF
jgi:hypothetical protein